MASSTGIPPALTWILASSGAWLVYSAVRGLSPLDEIRAALTGQASPGPRIVPDLAGVPVQPTSPEGAAIAADKAQLAPTGPCRPPSQLVPIGQGSHKLTPAAAQAFQLWQAAYGAPIKLTDSYRTCAAQAEGYKADPTRFAAPGSSLHPKGLAVDVNLAAIGAQPGTATFDRLYSTARQLGWYNPRGPGRGDGKEPWHFSYGVSG